MVRASSACGSLPRRASARRRKRFCSLTTARGRTRSASLSVCRACARSLVPRGVESLTLRKRFVSLSGMERESVFIQAARCKDISPRAWDGAKRVNDPREIQRSRVRNHHGVQISLLFSFGEGHWHTTYRTTRVPEKSLSPSTEHDGSFAAPCEDNICRARNVENTVTVIFKLEFRESSTQTANTTKC